MTNRNPNWVDEDAAADDDDLISALYMINLMFAFKCLFLNIQYVLMYVSKDLAAIFLVWSPCHLFLEDDTKIFDTIYKWDVPSIQLKVVPRHSTSFSEVDRLGLLFTDLYDPLLTA
jgi:hypothetical protein